MKSRLQIKFYIYKKIKKLILIFKSYIFHIIIINITKYKYFMHILFNFYSLNIIILHYKMSKIQNLNYSLLVIYTFYKSFTDKSSYKLGAILFDPKVEDRIVSDRMKFWMFGIESNQTSKKKAILNCMNFCMEKL